jgi:hypothetical protein
VVRSPDYSKSKKDRSKRTGGKNFDPSVNENEYGPVILKKRDQIMVIAHEIKKENPKVKLSETVSRFFSSSLHSRLLGVPQKLRAVLRYTDSYTHTHTSGAVQTWLFRGNSVFDPDYTYGGHQPVGFDEYAAFYQHYIVRRSRIVVYASSLTASVPQICIVRPVTEIVAATGYKEQVEATMSSYKVVPTTSIPIQTVENEASTAKLFEAQLSSDQDFGALVSADPAKVWFWQIVTQPANGASTATLALTAVIEYDVEFDQKQILATS